jgi:hypothetical protein
MNTSKITSNNNNTNSKLEEMNERVPPSSCKKGDGVCIGSTKLTNDNFETDDKHDKERVKNKRIHSEIKDGRKIITVTKDMVSNAVSQSPKTEPEPKVNTGQVNNQPVADFRTRSDILLDKIEYQDLVNKYSMLEPSPKHDPMFTFTYKTWIKKSYYGFCYSKEKLEVEETIPVSIKNVLIPLVPYDKAYPLYVSYLHKANNDKRIMQFFKDATTVEDLNSRRLKVQRFYWFDHPTLGQSAKSTEATFSKVKKQNRNKQAYLSEIDFNFVSWEIDYRTRLFGSIFLIFSFLTLWSYISVHYGFPPFVLVHVLFNCVFYLIRTIISFCYIDVSWVFGVRAQDMMQSFLTLHVPPKVHWSNWLGLPFIENIIWYCVQFYYYPLNTLIYFYDNFHLVYYCLKFLSFICYSPIIVILILTCLTIWNLCKDRKDEPRQLLLWDELPWLSIYLEELFKTAPYGAEVIGFLEYIKYGSWANYYMHKRITGKLSVRCRKHAELNKKLWDYWSNSTVNLDYDKFLSNLMEPMVKPYTIIEVCISNCLHANYKPLPIKMNEICLIQIPPKRHSQIKGKAMTEPIGETRYYEGVYPILFCQSRLYRPSKTFNNLKVAIDGRLHKEVPGSNGAGVRHWKRFLHEFGYNDEHVKALHNFDRDSWFKSLGKKQRDSILRDRERYSVQDPEEVEISIKSDEILYSNMELDIEPSEKKFVPRVLFNLSGWWLDQMGPSVEILTNHLKKKFDKFGNGRIAAYDFAQGYNTYVPYFTCGAQSDDLDTFMNLAHEAPHDEFWFMVMGDDMGARQEEADFSSFDRTQDKKIIGTLMTHVGHWGLGRMEWVWRHQYRVKKVAKHKHTNCKVDVNQKVGKMTGETPTCWSNSIMNIASTIHAHSSYSEDKVEEGYLDYGFVVKYQRPKYITFLKGVFLRNVVGRLQWTRLPSFMGKFGKTLTNFVNTVKIGKTIQEKAAYMLWAQWLGYGNMDTNWFFIEIGKIVKRLCSKYIDIRNVVPDNLDFWQVKSTPKAEITDNEFNQFMYNRYNLSPNDLQEFIDQLSGVQRLPTVYTSRIIDILVDRDYG